MRISHLSVLVLTSALVMQGCTKRSMQPEVTRQDNPQSADESPSVPVTLDEQSLRQQYTIDTSNMRYSFEYLSTKLDGDIKFENGKANLEFKNLQAGSRGTLSLTLLEAGVAKLRGEQNDVTLTRGQNKIVLAMKPVSGTEGGTLVVNVEMDLPNGGGAVVPPQGQPNPPQGQPNPPQGQPNPPQGQPNPPQGQPDTGGNLPSDPSAAGFARDIKPIFEAHCAECHHAGSQVPDLSSKAATETAYNLIVSRMEDTAKPMPPSPRDKVTARDLEKIRAWKSQGFRP